MTTERALFFRHLAQTSPSPMGLEISEAKGCLLIGTNGKEYLDLISGIAVSYLGHGNSAIIDAIKTQTEKHLHLMVYGEFIQSPQVQYGDAILQLLPAALDNIYFVNSGSEAIDGAIKLARRFTGRSGIIAFRNAYHGGTLGAISINGSEKYKCAFGKLLPGVVMADFGSEDVLEHIDESISCVIMEVIQAEAGVFSTKKEWLEKVAQKCRQQGVLLVFDEVQTAFGRTGKMFAFEHFDVIPDILVLGKALGAGMPLGAFISSKEIMLSLSHDPVLGHITTFGGHPVSCAAGSAGLGFLQRNDFQQQAEEKGKLFAEELKHRLIKDIRQHGLLIACEFDDSSLNIKVIKACIKRGLLTDWFLYNDKCMRICPPLTITHQEIYMACKKINEVLEEIT
ncbi:MAG: aspartate aminotransferase family protein [Bacteroidetes bacterium]|nr:aspartate aminotransferase family protein [Bacteroidota bacterium]